MTRTQKIGQRPKQKSLKLNDAPSPTFQLSSIQWHAVACVFIALTGILVYSNTLQVPFVLDDLTSVVANPLIRDFHFILKSRIIGDASFAVNYSLNGLEVAGYHMVNLLIHAANGCLVYALGCLLVKAQPLTDYFGTRRTIIPLLGALLFAVHPLQTQAVTYIAQRVTSLAAFFYLAAVCFYLVARYATSNGKKVPCFCLAMAAGLLAMMTKENAATLPLIILLCEAVLFSGGGWRRFGPSIGFFILSIIVPVALIVPRLHGASVLDALGEVTADTTTISRTVYLLTQCRVVATYLRLLVLPMGQNLDYDYPLSTSLTDPLTFLALLLHLMLLTGSLLLILRSRKAPAASAPLMTVGFGVLWFYLALVVESTLIPIRDVIFEHRVYLPSVGIFLATASLLEMARQRLRESHPQFLSTVTIAIWCLIPILAVGTIHRNSIWGDAKTLWEDVVAKSPGKARGHGILAQAYRDRGMVGEAVEEYETALRANPSDAAAHNNLATIYLEQKRYTSARRMLVRAVALNPGSAKAHYNLGNAHLALGQLNEAEREYKAALQQEPRYDQAMNNLGLARAKQGNLRDARDYFRKAVEVNPGNKEAAANLRELQDVQ